MENYVALDLETTGLSPKNDRILEIGAVKIEEGRETGRIATLIDPQMKIGADYGTDRDFSEDGKGNAGNW